MEYVRVELVTWLMPHIAEMVVRCFDNGEHFYTMFLNANMSNERLIEAYNHGMSHIDNNDFDNMWNVNELESIRH